MKKKIVYIALALLLIIGIAGTFWGSSIAEAATKTIWNSCPKGKVNDRYPGDCHDYIDTNKDKICDRSQPAPAAAAASTTTAAPKTTVASKTTVVPKTTPSSTPSVSSALVESSISAGSAVTAGVDNAGAVDTSAAAKTKGSSYYLVPLLAVFILAYCLTWILSAKKVFKTLTHRKIWNVILLVACLVSVLLGLILTFNLDFDTNITLPFNMLFWHVEAGIAMSVIAIFHIVWHWRYFVKILKVTGQAN
jgi:hypothetical protein